MAFYLALAFSVVFGWSGFKLAERYEGRCKWRGIYGLDLYTSVCWIATVLYAAGFLGCFLTGIIIGFSDPMKNHPLILKTAAVSASYFIAFIFSIAYEAFVSDFLNDAWWDAKDKARNVWHVLKS